MKKIIKLLISEDQILFYCLFFFIYGWGLTIYSFEIRYLIFFPLVFILKENIRYFSVKKFIKKYKITLILTFFLLFQYIYVYNFYLSIFNYKIISYYLALIGIFLIVEHYKKIILSKIISSAFFFVKYFFLIFLINLFFVAYFLFKNTEIHHSKIIFSCANGLFSYGKFFFNENSHLAICSVPIIFLYIAKNIVKSFLFIFFLILNYISYSTTFIITSTLCSLIFIVYYLLNKNFNKSYFLLILILLNLTILFFDKSCENKFLDTLKVITKNFFHTSESKKDIFLKDTDRVIYFNLSSQVIYNSIYVAKASFFKNPLGYGVNNYSYAFSAYDDISGFSNNFILQKLNNNDASNNFAKLVVEFGIFSLFLFVLSLFFLFNKKIESHSRIFIFSLFLSQLIRGAGYFNGGFAIGIAVIIIFYDRKVSVFNFSK